MIGKLRQCAAKDCGKFFTGRYPHAKYCSAKCYRRHNSKKFREANREKIAEWQRKFCEANREKFAEWQRKLREANREKINEKHRKFYEANREKINEKKRKSRRDRNQCQLEIENLALNSILIEENLHADARLAESENGTGGHIGEPGI